MHFANTRHAHHASSQSHPVLVSNTQSEREKESAYFSSWGETRVTRERLFRVTACSRLRVQPSFICHPHAAYEHAVKVNEQVP